MVKPRHVPCRPEDLRAARDALAPYTGLRVTGEGDEPVLLLRVPRPAPDLVADLDAAARLLPSRLAEDAVHVVLVGDRDAVVVSANALRPVLRARDEREAARLGEFRREPGYSFAWRRFPGDPPGSTRLLVRLPVARVGHLEERDADALAVAVGPTLDTGADRGALVAYLVADEDHARLPPGPFLAELRQRWVAAQQEADRRARPPAPPPPEPEPVATPAAPAPPPPDARARADVEATRMLDAFFAREAARRAPPARRTLPKPPPGDRPSRFVFAYSEVVEARPRTNPALPAVAPAAAAPAPSAAPPEADAEADVEPAPAPPPPPGPWAAVHEELRARLRSAGFDLLENVDHDGLRFAFAAAREGRQPEKLVVFTCDDLTPTLARRLLAATRALGVDAAVCLTPRPSVEAERNLLATKVSVYHPAALSELSFG